MIARLLALTALLVSVWTRHAQAQEQFRDNRYSIDLFTGPVLGSSRIVGLSGAYAAIATGIDGSVFNPAGYGERAEKEIRLWEFDVTAGVWFGGLFRNNDVDNNGKSGLSSTDVIQASGGLRMQFGPVGVGATALGRMYSIRNGDGLTYAEVLLATVRSGLGIAWHDGGLVTGVGMSRTTFNLTQPGRDLVNFTGYGAEAGVLLRPKLERYRLGVVARTPVHSRPGNPEATLDDDGVRRLDNFVLPASVRVPWEIDVGFAYQFGERRANVPWRSTRHLRRELTQRIAQNGYFPPDAFGEAPYPPLAGTREQAAETALSNELEAQRRFRRHQPRRYVLIAADLVLYGPTKNGQSLSAFLVQQPERSGEKISYGIRMGVESEVWQNRMKLRAGTYLEPSRTDRRYYRPHGTFGVDARLFDFWRWAMRATATVDGAPRYFNWGLALGLWW